MFVCGCGPHMRAKAHPGTPLLRRQDGLETRLCGLSAIPLAPSPPRRRILDRPSETMPRHHDGFETRLCGFSATSLAPPAVAPRRLILRRPSGTIHGIAAL